ncbi:hypothetical protein IFM89_018137 [Coptis chinensis]|uniref:Pentatricopeptide repeat-containing protein n=1 Tax=Coptis chinensis TaxID=261450 RepID=A0A835M015_9MAGN|nr:hypothetical protein IFM89_018137 [Coptis chinensis]
MPERDVVSWTILIEGNRSLRKYDDALFAFERMQFLGVLPNRVTMVIALSACAGSGALEMGVWIHDYVKRNEWEVDVILGTSLIDMYGKCGKIDVGLSVLKSMSEKNIFTWNAVIKGLALAKSGEEAVRWFSIMEVEGVTPDEVTLVGVLSACSHSGMVQTGRYIFQSMMDGKYGFRPNTKHYACMVDILARAGCLDEAVKLIETMPYEPSKTMWGALLAGSKAHGNLDLCEYAAWKLVELDPGNGAYYVMLSNLYAEMGRWNEVENVRRLMEDRGLQKDVGSSFIELETAEQVYNVFAT